MEEYREQPAEEESEEYLALPNEAEINQAIENLGEPCRTILLHYYFHQLSLERIAEQLHYANANVAKQQKFRCVER